MGPTAQCVYGGQLLPLAGEPMEPKGGLLAVVLPHDLGLAGSRYGSLTGERLAPRACVHEPLARIGQRGVPLVERERVAHGPVCRCHLRIAYTRPRQHVAFGLLTQQRLERFIVSAEGGTASYNRV